MKILLAGAYRYFWYEEVCAQALEKLGHQVTRYRWNGLFKGKLGALQEKWLLGPSVVWANLGIIAHARACQPDIIFLWRGTPIWPKTLQTLRRKTGALLVAYNNDDPFGPSRRQALWRYFVPCIPEYDIHFVYRRVNVSEYQAAGARYVEVMMPYYIPEIHQPMDLPPEDRERYACDMVFVGHYEDDGRIDFLRAVVQSGIHVRLFGGKYWRPKVLGDLADYFGPVSPIYGEEYVKALTGAKLCLAFLSRLNRDTYTRRSFEIPACGCLMLSERTDDLMRLYKDDEEVVFFSSPEELVASAKVLLRDERRRRQIAAAGRQRCITDGHDIVNRMRQFCRVVT
jgi:spore maturation protein CgeB